MPAICNECKQPLIMIDNRGRHLQGCLTCNEWRDSAGNAVKLSVEDLAALHARIEKMKAMARRNAPILSSVQIVSVNLVSLG